MHRVRLTLSTRRGTEVRLVLPAAAGWGEATPRRSPSAGSLVVGISALFSAAAEDAARSVPRSLSEKNGYETVGNEALIELLEQQG